MPSFRLRHPILVRFADRLSFKKLKEVQDDEDPARFEFIYDDWERRAEYNWTLRSSPNSPPSSFSDYNGGVKLKRKKRLHPSDEQDQHYQIHYHDICYNPDGTVNTRVTDANVQARWANEKRRSFVLIAIDGTLGKIKWILASPDRSETKKKVRFANGGKVNADVRIQFDGEKFIYRV